MNKIVSIVAIASLIACAEVPYGEDGQVTLPTVANFAEPASEGQLDHALDELLIKIKPGQETLRVLTVGATAAVLFCQIRDCRGSHRLRANLAVPLSPRQGSSVLLSQFDGHERTHGQVRQLADLSEAFADMAERDVIGLRIATDVGEAESWEALYRARFEKMRRGLQASVETRKQLTAFRGLVQRQLSGRDIVPRVVELERTSSTQIARIASANRRLRIAIDDLARFLAARTTELSQDP